MIFEKKLSLFLRDINLVWNFQRKGLLLHHKNTSIFMCHNVARFHLDSLCFKVNYYDSLEITPKASANDVSICLLFKL